MAWWASSPGLDCLREAVGFFFLFFSHFIIIYFVPSGVSGFLPSNSTMFSPDNEYLSVTSPPLSPHTEIISLCDSRDWEVEWLQCSRHSQIATVLRCTGKIAVVKVGKSDSAEDQPCSDSVFQCSHTKFPPFLGNAVLYYLETVTAQSSECLIQTETGP